MSKKPKPAGSVGTPATQLIASTGMPYTLHSYVHEPTTASYGLEAAESLGVDPRRVFKTLVVRATEGWLAIGVVPVDAMLNLKAIADALGTKRAEMAEPAAAVRATGYVVGGISPLAQKNALPTVIDESALAFDTVFVSAGRRGLEIELAPTQLIRLTGATPAVIATPRPLSPSG